MQLLVTVAQVASVDGRIEFVDGAIDERSLDYECNEWDRHALAWANRLAEARDDEVEIVAVTIGPERSDEVLRAALARGADRAIRVWDDALADRTFLGVRARARLLAGVVGAESPDLVLSGVQTSDHAFAATGVALASAADLGWAAVAGDLTLAEDGTTVTVHRELEGGVEEVTEVECPAVVTIQTGPAGARYASLGAIRDAHRSDVAVVTASDLDVPPAALDTAVAAVEHRRPAGGEETTFVEGSPTEQATKLATLLRERGVIE